MATAPTHTLTKSTYMRGHQCLKALSFHTHRRELMTPLTEAQQAAFSVGSLVGQLAQALFPGGVNMRPESAWDFRESLKQTSEAVQAEVPVLYEAAFVHDRVLAAVDILRKDGAGWQLIEVKSTNSVKSQHIADAALQYHVLTAVGVPITDVSILHLNKDYVRRGALDLAALFRATSVLAEVRAILGGVPARITSCKQVVRSPE